MRENRPVRSNKASAVRIFQYFQSIRSHTHHTKYDPFIHVRYSCVKRQQEFTLSSPQSPCLRIDYDAF